MILANTYKEIGYERQYASSLAKIIELNTKNEEIYYSLATYYYDNYKYHDSLNTLKKGILNLKSQKLKDFYEQIRYKTYYLFCYEDEVLPFSEGYAAVKKNNKWGYIDEKGNLVIDYKFDKATSFNNSRALVVKNNVTSIINKNGFNTKVADFKTTGITSFNENGAAIKTNNKWKIINDEFNITTETWQDIGVYFNGLIAVKNNNLWGLRQKGGKLLLDYKYKNISLNEHRKCFLNNTCFALINNKYQLIDLNGTIISKNSWQEAKEFNEKNSYAAVKKDNKWGFVNNLGEEVLANTWQNAKSFSNGLAAVKKGNKWGFINESGRLVIGAIYDDVQSFYNGLAAVKKDNVWRFLGLEQYRYKSNLLCNSLGGLINE